MKIQQNSGVNQERFFSVRGREKDSPSFQEVLNVKQGQLSKDRLQSLFKEIEKQGNSLCTSRSLKDLMEYKQKIRDFMKEVAYNGFSLEEHHGFQSNGREKRLMMIKQMDQQLIDLSEQVLQNQATTVGLLEKMDEIKGILINLYG